MGKNPIPTPPIQLPPKIVIVSGLTLPDKKYPHIDMIRTDIGSILDNLDKIQSADIAIFLDDGHLFDLPTTDKGIRSLLERLSLVSKAEAKVIGERFPAPFDDDALGYPSGCAVELLTYDFRQELIHKNSDNTYEWLGTKETENPVFQRNRLTMAVADVACRCFDGGKGGGEQHVWILFRESSNRFHNNVMLKLLFENDRPKQKWGVKRGVSKGPIVEVCHQLRIREPSLRYLLPPDRKGLLFQHLGRIDDVIPLKNSTGIVSGFQVSKAKMRMAWLDLSRTLTDDESVISICLAQFGITWPPTQSGTTMPMLTLSLDIGKLGNNRKGRVVWYVSNGKRTPVIMGHRAFLLLLAHVVSALRGEAGINPRTPRIAGKRIEQYYKPCSVAARREEHIHAPFELVGLQTDIVRQADSVINQTGPTLYCLALPPDHVDIRELAKSEDPDIKALLALLPRDKGTQAHPAKSR